MKTEGEYYLGKRVELDKSESEDQPLLYDPDDLTTHAVVVGMTGSGKTGLCIDLLEEAALNKVPALMIDPKGDITNAVLHFPKMAPTDFRPWINAEEARREGKSLDEVAADTASMWRKGLTQWDIGPSRVQALKDSASFTIYTPGSDVGVPVSILASLKAPDLSWNENREVLLERISGTVSALLGLIGLKDVDPVRSREHILLANIFEHAWRQRQDLTLGELILRTQSPPFEKLGVFDVNTFFPEKDRFGLAMLLNNILAAPTFKSWIEGQPLDIQNLLYEPDGRPKHSIFYIAHLNDDERMFFVSLLFSAFETWMRSQKGSTTLRALLYFDEIFGYLPPIGNPPSKESMLRMLKQARAFGVGLVLATQNPVDVDYKALSNAGTWFIGKLQTDQDKQRLLDGLSGAAGGLDRRQYDDMLSGLGKRVFLLHNVHEKQPVLFQTRWAMNYLAGPMTRTQIPALNELAGVDLEAITAVSSAAGPAAPVAAGKPAAEVEIPVGSPTEPTAPRGIMAYYLPMNLSLSEAAQKARQTLPSEEKSLVALYRPALLAQANARINSAKYNLIHDLTTTVLVREPDRRGMIQWDLHKSAPLDTRALDRQPVPGSYFGTLDEPFNDGQIMKRLKSDFLDWVYQVSEVMVRVNEDLEVFASPDVSKEEYRKMCAKAAAEKIEEEQEKIAESYERKIDRIEDKLSREERELEDDKAELAQRKREEGVTHLETVAGLFSRRRRSLSSSMTKRRMTEKAKADVEESIEAIEKYQEELEELEAAMNEELEEVKARWEDIVDEVSEIPIRPYKKDILDELFGVAWFPYYVIDTERGRVEIAAFDESS